MNEDRGWMYTGHKSKDNISREWIDKTTEFLDHAFARNTDHFGVMCPCNRCYNRRPQIRSKMIEHLVNNGFRLGYTVWVHHGERGQSRSDVIRQRTDDGGGYNENRIPEMVGDVRHAFDIPLDPDVVYKAGCGKKHSRHFLVDGYIDSRISASQSRSMSTGTKDSIRSSSRIKTPVDRIVDLETKVGEIHQMLLQLTQNQNLLNNGIVGTTGGTPETTSSVGNNLVANIDNSPPEQVEECNDDVVL